MRRTNPLLSGQDNKKTRDKGIADYQIHLSKMIQLSKNVSIGQMQDLETLCNRMITNFPKLKITDQQYWITCLNTTIINVWDTDKILYRDFIANIIHDGIVQSCSHMSSTEVEVQSGTDEVRTFQHQKTDKDYVALWCGILNSKCWVTESRKTCVTALRIIVDQLVATCAKLVSTLNLEVKSSKENIMFDKAQFSRMPVNETDCHTFLNLVDLYVEILPCIDSHLRSDRDEKLIREIIKKSYKSPSIPEFYKLASATLVSSSIFSPRNPSSSDASELVLQYLRSIIDELPGYSQELQISCLQLVLSAPEELVPRIADHAIPAFQIALTLGLKNYEIASTTLGALERWWECSGMENRREFVSRIVPYLAAFLEIEKPSKRFIEDIEETRQGGRGKCSGEGRRSNVVANDKCTIEAFQKRILLFLGSLDYEIMSSYIYERSMKTGATWSEKNLLKYTMPFRDTNLDIYLDSMLPRIMELAQNSGDRDTRVTACKVLRTLVAFVLEKMNDFSSPDKDNFATIYEILYPVLLKLSCDSDDEIRQLFDPLKITLGASSNLILNSVSTKHLVDTLFEGLSDGSNSSLRERSGICIVEIVSWSIEQLSDVSQPNAECATNVHLILHRIIDFARDPSPRKRVAAAIAFIPLCPIICKNEALVNKFWLAILHAFVSSLDGCCDARIDESLSLVQGVLNDKSIMFNKVNPDRIVPPGFDGSTIVDALDWIFQRCGSLDYHCRKNCMDIFVNLSMNAPSTEINSPKDAIEIYLKRHTESGINEILIGDTRNENDRATTTQGFASLKRTLDLYFWLIRNDVIDIKVLFGENNSCRKIVFNRVNKIVEDCLVIINTDNAVENESSGKLREFLRSRTLRCETILMLFDFVLLLLELRTAETFHVPDDAFYIQFFSLVASCLMKPEILGFDSSNLQLTEQLPAKLEYFLKKSMETLNPELASHCQTRLELTCEIESFSEQLFSFYWVKARGSSLPSKNRVRGLIILQKSDILKIEKSYDSIRANASKKLKKIFDLLGSEKLGESVCFYLKSETRNYLESLIELLLENITVETILERLDSPKRLKRLDTTDVTHGEYFFSTFRSVLIRGLVRNFEFTLNWLVCSMKKDQDYAMRIVEAIVLYLQDNRNEYGRIVERCASALIAKFPEFNSSLDIECRQKFIFNIYGKIVRLREGQLLLHENSNDHDNLVRILEKCCNAKNSNYFPMLLKLLPETKSTIVLRAIIRISSYAILAPHDGLIQKQLKLYYKALKEPAAALESLQNTYKDFSGFTDVKKRLDFLRYILLHSLNACDVSTKKKFFEQNKREFYEIIERPTSDKDQNERAQLFVSKIAVYNLMTIIFATVPRERINPKSVSSNVVERWTEDFFDNTLQIRQLCAKMDHDRNIIRWVHCAAFNCCITIIDRTREEQFYLAAFTENRNENRTIWEKIVDVKCKYYLRQTSKKCTKEREDSVNMRKHECRSRNSPSDRYSYIKSYEMVTSTLTENIYAYDLFTMNLIPKSKNKVTSAKLDIDELGEHECMSVICGFFKHIQEEISSRRSNGVAELPDWMEQFRISMGSDRSNVRLFLLKVVLNNQPVFRAYAKYFVEPVTNTIYKCLTKNSTLSYIVTDALLMLVDWAKIAVHDTEEEKELARSMFASLLEESVTAPTQSLVKYNLSIIEMIVDSWHEYLEVPKFIMDCIGRDDRTAIELVLIFLTNKMEHKIVAKDEIWDYVVKCLSCWQIKEVSVLQCYEAAGLMLKYTKDTQKYDARLNEIKNTLPIVFVCMQIHPSRLIKCIDALWKACDSLVSVFFQDVLSIQPQLSNLLMNKSCHYASACLRIVELLVGKLQTDIQLELAKLVVLYSSEEILEYRQLCHRIFAKLYKTYSAEKSDDKQEIIDICTKGLLSGILDPANEIQKSCFDIWCRITTGLNEIFERFLDVLDTYMCGIASNFLQIVTLVLLELMRRGVGCETTMFDPLNNFTCDDQEISHAPAGTSSFNNRVNNSPVPKEIRTAFESPLGPIQELAKRDPQICKDLLVTMVVSLLRPSKHKSDIKIFLSKISSRFRRILGDGRKNSDMVAAILEILFQVPDLEYSASMVAQVAINYGLHAEGACLMEQSLIRSLSVSSLELPTEKRTRVSMKGLEEKENRIKLASLYESMDEIDLVLGIFRDDIFTADLHATALARASNHWIKADEYYHKIFESEIDEQTKQHCLPGSFECLARLGKWKKLEEDINTRINHNFENLLTPDSDELNWMAPWVFRTHTQSIVNSRGNEKFVTAMSIFLKSKASYQLLKEHYGEETAVILCTIKPEASRDFLNGSWEKVRQRWSRSSAHSGSPITQAHILEMRGIQDIERYLRAIADISDIAESWRELDKRWNNSVPSNRDDLFAWDVLTSYRLYFCESFIKAASTNRCQETDALIDKIRNSKIQQMLKIIGCSLSQKNLQLAKRYILRVEAELTNPVVKTLTDELRINIVSYKFFEAQTSSNPEASFKHYSSVWKESHNILHSHSLPVRSKIAIRQVISEVSSNLAKKDEKNKGFIRKLMASTKLAENISSERGDFGNDGESLIQYGFTNLQECCKLAFDDADANHLLVSECYLRLTKYCYESIIRVGNCDERWSREFVVSTLRAMAHGSDEATYYFPYLLKDNVLSNDEIRLVFTEEVTKVESWRFLVWQTKLLTHLSTSNLVWPIVERLIETYPGAMVYSVRLAIDTNPKISRPDLENFLSGKENYGRFLQSMEYAVSHLFVEYSLKEFARNFCNDQERAFARLVEKLYPSATQDAQLQGNVLRGIVTLYKSKIEGMRVKSNTEVQNLVHDILVRLHKSTSNRRENNELEFYGPWLCQYAGRDIEVPGQYNVNEKPKPFYHANIVKVEWKIKVTQSLHDSITITILATDGRQYRFLAKFGEDLRLDQRTEQVFGVMNDKLKSDAACAQHRLSIDTYQVIPLSGSFGLIQWIDDTKTLQEYITFSINDTDKKHHGQVAKEYEEWIGNAAKEESPSVQYKKALAYKANDVCAKLNEFTTRIRGDTLRNTFVRLSTCIENFMSLRRNFTTTYATMCIAQWILGIGDRHPANTLLKVESGRSVGIDFASAFGGGIDREVPELMPFRLTSQIKGMLVPFNEYDAMGATMIRVLRALQSNRGSLLAFLDVVAHEQLYWQDPSSDTNLPKRKVSIISKKLDGGKPSSITLEQLAERHFDEKYYPRYEAIVNGTDFTDISHDCKRKSYEDYNLSPEEQVQCLIEQATDSNVLGRTHVKWMPWL